MVVLDTIGTGMSSAFVLSFMAIVGFITLKVGVISFNIVMDAVKATKGIENIRGVMNPLQITEEKTENEIKRDISYINAIELTPGKYFAKTKNERNYPYTFMQLFKK